MCSLKRNVKEWLESFLMMQKSHLSRTYFFFEFSKFRFRYKVYTYLLTYSMVQGPS